MKITIKVKTHEIEKNLIAQKGEILLEILRKNNIQIDAPCGGKGVCKKCIVYIQKEKNNKNLQKVLACQYKVESPVEVIVPFSYQKEKILTTGISTSMKIEPSIIKKFFTAPLPSIEDQRADTTRIKASVKEIKKIDLDIIKVLPEFLRKNNFQATAVIYEDTLIGIEKGNTTENIFGIAFDIGTTTVVGSLHNLFTGRTIGIVSRSNPQKIYGQDVISRAEAIIHNKKNLDKLQELIISCINDILEELCTTNNIRRENIYEVVLAGNTIMNHLLLGLDPSAIVMSPYIPCNILPLIVLAKDLGIKINPSGRVYTLPNIAGYVGGDTVGVILATNIHKREEICLAIDIGTNGEIILGNKEKIFTCATAAGPAFEGARISFGMRAKEGAIERITCNGDIKFSVIGNTLPQGICGSGLIELVACLLDREIIDYTGKFKEKEELPEPLKKRLIQYNNMKAFLIAEKEKYKISDDIVLTQKDIRELQLAKGAIAAGTEILLEEYGISIDKIKHIFLAGAFGNFIRKECALRIGLLPKVPPEKIVFVGNAALTGAQQVLLSKAKRKEAIEISNRTKYIELSSSKMFQDKFMERMFF